LSGPFPAPALLRAFVRETLGCTCPDAVFEAVERTEAATPGSGVPYTRWVVGGRLLIYVARPQSAPAESAGELAALGREDRDRRGLNRFRLVIASAACEEEAHAIARAFAVVAGQDPKAHLHCVAPERCVGLLAGG
jgi:hypothetical protein